MKVRYRVVLCSAVLSLSLAEAAFAQLISVRTVPVAQANQFDIFPSQNAGMGGVSLALPDTLLDPFSNPAKASRLTSSRVFGSPGVYSISSNAGGGRSLPVGALMRSGSWFGGLALALQEVDPAQRFDFFGPIIAVDAIGGFGPSSVVTEPDNSSKGNTFGVLMLGRRFGAGVSAAGSLRFAQLHAVDGVDAMYANSQRVDQSGGSVDARLGILKEWAGGQAMEAVLVHNRFRMTHDVTYLDIVWDPATQGPMGIPRLEQNLDHTNTWGLHLSYERPIPNSRWRLGWIATANRMSHPKIPNYEIMNIPRDPGYTSAFNLGMGLSRRQGAETFGIDVIYEPIVSHTWAEAAAPITIPGRPAIPAGGRTIENRFRFSNAEVRMGFGWDLDPGSPDRGASMQLGLVVRAVRYHLNQDDLVQATSRQLAESWTEWTPTWGLGLAMSTFEIRYRGQVTHGTGRPGVSGGFGCPNCDRGAPPPSGGVIIAAPSGPLTLDKVRVVTHQVSLSLPLH